MKMKEIFCRFSFESLIDYLVLISWKKYNALIIFLVAIGAMCNYCSIRPLPNFLILVIGFVLVVYFDLYSLKQVRLFCDLRKSDMIIDKILVTTRLELFNRLHSNRNWISVLLIPTAIVPVVIYIIKYPLGLPIMIFAYTALYVIIALCVIGYSEYLYLIMLSFELQKSANSIIRYESNRPRKTSWLEGLAKLTNMQSNLFFVVGAIFIALLYLITLSGNYKVDIQSGLSKIMVIYLWLLVIGGIAIMFPVLSFCSYSFIKSLTSKLVETSIVSCERMDKIINKSKQKNLLKPLNDMKILMLERTPLYPQKPMISYAISYIIAIINFIASIDATMQLNNYIR